MNKQNKGIHFMLGLKSEPPGYQAENSVNSPFLHRALRESTEHMEGEDIERYLLCEQNLAVSVHTEKIPGSCVKRQYTVVENTGSSAQRLNGISSAFVTGIGVGGSLPWYHPERFRLHYCLQAWEGEGQWRATTLAEQNLLPVSTHPVAAAIHFSETSSWTTSRYYPMVVLEDRELEKSWFVQLEEGAGWHIEIAHLGDPYAGELCILADNFNERFGGGRQVLLAAGEVCTSSRAAFGCCCGGFEEAVRQLAIYRRAVLRRLPSDGIYPLVFNDYMNCLWGNPTADNLLPLIDAAAEAGAEYFCLDAGWFTNQADGWNAQLGDWNPSQDRFAPYGFSYILDTIQQKGMKPGIWLELECVSKDTAIYKTAPQNWLLQQEGETAGGGVRYFWDYQNPQVQAHFLQKIGELYALGVRYIKNDYNESFVMADNYTGDRVESVQIAMGAFGTFIDKVLQQFPDLLMECCSSGAMRSDYGILRHFHVQSVSDQELYIKMPSILMGTLAQMLPEQVACWCYPCPVLFDERDELPYASKPEWADGEETVFNMVTGLCSVPLLSGHIDLADEKNRKLIREAFTLYKERRDFIKNAYPVYPLGMKRIEDEQGFVCLGLLAGGTLQLAVWRLKGEEDNVCIPIKYGQTGSVRQIYPAEGYDTEVSLEKGSLAVHMGKQLSARLFEITVEEQNAGNT